jgi:hypothetical protein
MPQKTLPVLLVAGVLATGVILLFTTTKAPARNRIKSEEPGTRHELLNSTGDRRVGALLHIPDCQPNTDRVAGVSPVV